MLVRLHLLLAQALFMVAVAAAAAATMEPLVVQEDQGAAVLALLGLQLRLLARQIRVAAVEVEVDSQEWATA